MFDWVNWAGGMLHICVNVYSISKPDTFLPLRPALGLVLFTWAGNCSAPFYGMFTGCLRKIEFLKWKQINFLVIHAKRGNCQGF